MNYIPVYNFDLLPVLLAIVFVSCVVLWIAIRNYQNFVFMFFLIPLTLFAGWTIYTTVDELLGYPVVDRIEKDTIYLYHIEDPITDWIYVWVIFPGDSRPKAIMIPKTENNEKQMGEADERKEQGIPQAMKPLVNGEGETLGGELSTYNFQKNHDNVHKENQKKQDEEEENNRIKPQLDYLKEESERTNSPIIPGPAKGRTDGPMLGGNQRLEWDESSEIPDIWEYETTSEEEYINPFSLGNDNMLP